MPALIGFDKLYYAVLSSDNISTGSATYGTPVRIAGAVSANINPNSSTETLFADNGPMDSATALGKISLDLTVADFDPVNQSIILGHQYVSGMLVKKGTDTPPWIAVGGRALKSNGAYRYFWLVKGKMSDPEAKNETKKDKVNFTTPTMKGEFVRRDCDDVWKVEYDTDCAEYDPTVESAWFTKVMSVSDLPLGCTITPLNGATSVPVNSTITVVFSKAITPSLATSTNLTLATDATPGTPISTTVSIAGDNKTVTITPSSALLSATKYRVVVKAATGLSADKLFTFTTA